MITHRIIPCLLLKNSGLVKTIRFKNPKYVGDPINTLKIFNEKEVDEIVFLDIRATLENKAPPFKLMEQVASECFMPLGYGGGIRKIQEMKTLFSIGVEKIIINSYAIENPSFIREVADLFGSQSIVVSIDVAKNWFGKYYVYKNSGTVNTGIDPVTHAVNMEKMGAGEIFLNSIDRDGMMAGYNLDLIKLVAQNLNIPVVACGGAKNMSDIASAINIAGAAAAAAGSIFVFQGPHKAVLISYPSGNEIKKLFEEPRI
jgi:cyclase